jgi:glycosyltransferase involved in cell wall biosynthesis
VKVAVFARALTRRSTGRGVYAAEMLRALAARGGVELDVFAGEPVDVAGCRFWSARGRTAVGSVWRVWRGIARDVRALAPDLLWSATHFLPRGLPRGLPTVVTLLDAVWRDHPETVSRGRRWAAPWLEEGLRRADRIVCISRFTRDRLAVHWPDLLPRAEVIHLAPNPRLPALPAEPALLARLGLDRPFVMTVGTLEPRKNLGHLLDAMRLVPGLLLVHCGPAGWNVQRLGERVRRAPDVRLLGWVDEPTLAALYRSALAAVFPSIYEGFDLPALDAASLGCPLVVSDIPVHREILGEAPLYSPPDRPELLAERIRSLRDSEEQRRARSQRLVERAAQFDWSRSAAQLMRLFRNASKGNKEASFGP